MAIAGTNYNTPGTALIELDTQMARSKTKKKQKCLNEMQALLPMASTKLNATKMIEETNGTYSPFFRAQKCFPFIVFQTMLLF